MSSVHGLLRSFLRQLAADARVYARFERDGERMGRAWAVGTALMSRGLWLLTFHRLSHFCIRHHHDRDAVWWAARAASALGRVFSVVACRSEIVSECEIGASVYLSSQGYLICGARSIGSGTVVHDRCTFGQDVVGRAEGLPHVGKDVWIGPGCILSGLIVVGDGATLMPHTFVRSSVPARAVVSGNPARIVRRDFDNARLRNRPRIVADACELDS